MSNDRSVVFFVMLPLAFLLFALVTVGAAWIWEAYQPYRGPDGGQFWIFASAVAMTISAVLAIMAVGAGLFQLRAASRTWFFSVADRLMTEFTRPERIEERARIYKEFPPPKAGAARSKAPPKTLTKAQRKLMRPTLDLIDRAGMLVDGRTSESRVLASWLSPIVVKVWACVGHYVEDEAVRRKAEDHYENARRFAAECARARAKRGITEDTSPRPEE